MFIFTDIAGGGKVDPMPGLRLDRKFLTDLLGLDQVRIAAQPTLGDRPIPGSAVVMQLAHVRTEAGTGERLVGVPAVLLHGNQREVGHA